MLLRFLASGRFRRVATLAALLWLCQAGSALASVTLLADLNGDGRADQIKIVTRHGHSALRMSIAGGRTTWLRLSKPLLRLVARDLDHDGDIDLIATTDGWELMAWLNHGRGRFSQARPHAHAHRGVNRAAVFKGIAVRDRLDFGIGADAIVSGSSPSVRLTIPIALLYFAPASFPVVSTPYGPRAPPAI